MPYEEEILNELKKISKILVLTNGAELEKQLEKYATNEDRKKVWVLIDDNRQVDDILRESGLKQRAVYNFLKNLEDAQLIAREFNKPLTKTIDFVPASWLELIQTSQQPANESNVNDTVQVNEGESNG